MRNKFLFSICLALGMSGCSTLPSKRVVENKYLGDQAIPNEKASEIKNRLTLGVNNATSGYSASATLITDALIIAEQSETGKKNMESETVVQGKIREEKNAFTKNKTCLLVSVDTYSLETAHFRNWVVKAKDSTGKIHDLTLTSTRGVASVPSTYQDINGRDWHNTTYACGPKIDLNGDLTVFLIPQLQENGKAELSFKFGP